MDDGTGQDRPFRLVGLDHVVLNVSEVERSLAFYVGVLGCTVERVRADLGLTHLRAGRSMIDLQASTGPAPAKSHPNVHHFALRIDGYDEPALTAYLQFHNIAVERPAQRFGAEGEGPSLYVRDPDGNLVELKGAGSG